VVTAACGLPSRALRQGRTVRPCSEAPLGDARRPARERQVDLEHAPLAELGAQREEGLPRLGGQDGARGLAVEPVAQASLARLERCRETRRAARHEGIGERAALAGAQRVGRATGGLVQHQRAGPLPEDHAVELRLGHDRGRLGELRF
jgi:hypothetical protein